MGITTITYIGTPIGYNYSLLIAKLPLEVALNVHNIVPVSVVISRVKWSHYLYYTSLTQDQLDTQT